MISRKRPCLGANSISEFGCSHKDMWDIHAASDRTLRLALTEKAEEARMQGHLSAHPSPADTATFILANLAAIRLAARSGVESSQLRALSKTVPQAVMRIF
jgi:hypothetical protein